MTVQNAIAIAGGFGPRGYKDSVDLTRIVGGELLTTSVPLSFPGPARRYDYGAGTVLLVNGSFRMSRVDSHQENFRGDELQMLVPAASGANRLLRPRSRPRKMRPTAASFGRAGNSSRLRAECGLECSDGGA